LIEFEDIRSFFVAELRRDVFYARMLKFYFAPDTCSLASLIVLEDVGVEYQSEVIDFRTQMQRQSEFLAINPKGRVPVLVTDKGPLTETPAILAYLAQISSDANVAPLSDPFAFGKMQEFNSYLCSTLHVAHAHRMRGYRWSDDPDCITSMQRKVPAAVTEAYRYIEDCAFVGPYVLGDEYSVADPYLFTIAQWMESDGVVVRDFPKVSAHRMMMRARPNVRRALEIESNTIE
jgi:glutathione S-transferase